MARPIKDLSGKVINNFKVISFFERDCKNNRTYWKCKCLKCGKEVIRTNDQIHKAIACGCLKGKSSKYKNTGNEKLYKRWWHMINRCYNEKDISFPNYGAKGITVSEEWKDYDKFYEWAIANGYSDDLEIDRINNLEGYSKDNCRFISKRENANNKSNNKKYIFRGNIMPLSSIADELGIKYKTLWQSINRDGMMSKYGISNV